MKVLEVGGGNSTLWFLQQGCEVMTIEHDGDWARYIKDFVASELGSTAKNNLHMYVEQGASAIELINTAADDHYDLVLVDCMNKFTWRKECVAAARRKVKAGGWLCLDNSDHPNNWNAVELMHDRKRIRYTGWAPMCSVVTQTSFWQM